MSVDNRAEVVVTGASAGGGRSYESSPGTAHIGLDRAEERPWIPVLPAAGATLDAAQAGKLAVDRWKEYQKFCVWCLVARCTFTTVPLALPKARAALRRVLGLGKR